MARCVQTVVLTAILALVAGWADFAFRGASSQRAARLAWTAVLKSILAAAARGADLAFWDDSGEHVPRFIQIVV